MGVATMVTGCKQGARSARSLDAACVHRFAAENADAMLKSAEILSRGFCALADALRGTASMTVDDGRSAVRALMGCGSASQSIELQTELVKLNAGRATIRALLLSVMTVQVAEEAMVPLISRINAAFGLVTGSVAA